LAALVAGREAGDGNHAASRAESLIIYATIIRRSVDIALWCPPEGDHPHRYLFTVFAVGADRLPVATDTSAAVVGFSVHFNTLTKTASMGLFKR
jgi:phosphatidylethanolamine-binding protein (PEBP) family uncharacterized protein